jgi:DNA polymerase-1
VITLDFETEAIQSRPAYPPKPVGLAVRWETGKTEYLAFGHREGNNSTKEAAARVVRAAFRGDHGPVLFHNGIFDIDVAQSAFGIKQWPKEYEDTLYLAFLNDPRSESLSLKYLAQKHLGMKPAARDRLREWLTENIAEVRAKPSSFGAYICAAPGDLVGKYAIDDVKMTHRLFKHLGASIEERGMLDAYQRELDLTPVTLSMENTGLRADVRGLKRLAKALTALRDDCDKKLRRRLKVDASFNLDAPAQVGARLADLGLLSRITRTATGKQSTAKGVLVDTCTDQKIVQLLNLRGVATKYLNTFVERWIADAERSGGRIYPRFHQVRSHESDRTGGGGTRTGRYSSSDPNFQNIPTNTDESRDSGTLTLLAAELAKHGFPGFAGLRHFILPDEGKVWASLDYNQQELRILAHFEQGQLLNAYTKNPMLDVHTWLQGMVKDLTGTEYPRKFIKTVVFGLIYGMGFKKLGHSLGIADTDAANLRNGVLRALPGVKTLMDSTRATIYTWGGREYPVEDPAQLDGTEDSPGRLMTFEYKQLNYLIQGSAADCTKQGMLNVASAGLGGRIAVQVHDELCLMVSDKAEAKSAAEAMCDVAFNVPMRAEPKLSRKSWGAVR